jgi:micrococcal nuclease
MAAVAACDGGEKTRHVVDRVLDGDTIELTTGERIRLLGVDSPERSNPAECWGEEAYTFLDTKLDGQTIKLEYDVEREDTFGRTLAWVHLGDELVNATLVSEGHACVLIIPPNGQTRESYLEGLETQAQGANRGLWLTCEGCDTPAFTGGRD